MALHPRENFQERRAGDEQLMSESARAEEDDGPFGSGTRGGRRCFGTEHFGGEEKIAGNQRILGPVLSVELDGAYADDDHSRNGEACRGQHLSRLQDARLEPFDCGCTKRLVESLADRPHRTAGDGLNAGRREPELVEQLG